MTTALQTRTDSVMEALTNTAIGFVVSYITWALVGPAYGLHLSRADNLGITAVFTVVSIARQYILRRLFNGKSVWRALREALRHDR